MKIFLDIDSARKKRLLFFGLIILASLLTIYRDNNKVGMGCKVNAVALLLWLPYAAVGRWGMFGWLGGRSETWLLTTLVSVLS